MRNIILALILLGAAGLALADKPVLPEDQNGILPVNDAYFQTYINKCLQAGEYTTKLVKGCDPADPIYEIDYKTPIKKVLKKVTKSAVAAEQ